MLRTAVSCCKQTLTGLARASGVNGPRVYPAPLELHKLPIIAAGCQQNALHNFSRSCVGHRCIHTSSGVSVLEKDVLGKKRAYRLGQEEKYERSDAPVDRKVQVADLTQAGTVIPSLETLDRLYGGVPFRELPVVHIKAYPNNTIITVSEHTGKTYLRVSCGSEGFRNVKKSTNVAAQATALTAGIKAQRLGLKQVRVCLKGFGAGRNASVTGLQMSGLEIISLTDTSPIKHSGMKPRKPRRL